MLILTFGLLAIVKSDAVEQGSPSLYCADLNPQNSVDISQVELFSISLICSHNFANKNGEIKLSLNN